MPPTRGSGGRRMLRCGRVLIAAACLLRLITVAEGYMFKKPSMMCAEGPIAAGCCDPEAFPKPKAATRPPKSLMLIIGASQCGATYLFGELAKHPSFRLPVHKEPHFFSHEMDRRKSATLEDYLAMWPDMATDGQSEDATFLEASASYYNSPAALCRIHKWLPTAKFVIILKEPSAHAYSQVDFSRRQCIVQDESSNCAPSSSVYAPFSQQVLGALAQVYEGCPSGYSLKEGTLSYKDLEGCANEEPRGLLSNGMYAPIIAWWLEFFPPEQLLILYSHELQRDPVTQLNKVLKFMGIKVPYTQAMLAQSTDIETTPNVGAYEIYEAYLHSTLEELREFYEPHNKDLYELLEEFKLPVSAFEPEPIENGPRVDCGRQITAKDNFKKLQQFMEKDHVARKVYMQLINEAERLAENDQQNRKIRSQIT